MGRKRKLSKTETINENEPNNKLPEIKRYRLRSGNIGALPTTTDGKSVKQETKDHKPQKPLQPRPFIEYKGHVEYYTKMVDITNACDALLKWINEQEAHTIPIAFDMEWPFSFQTGSGRSAVIQLCADINRCYVLHISQLKQLPTSLLDILYHKRVCLHGVCVKNDCRKLERDFPIVDSQRMIDQCKDLGVWCNSVMRTGGRWSMERLVMYICKLRINKEGKVRRSKWDVQPLTADQQIYAAIDVYISQVIYLELERREKQNAKEDQDIIEEHGEKALAAIEKLR